VSTVRAGAAFRAPEALGGAGLFLVAWAFFFGGGSGDGRLLWLGGAALLLAASAAAAVLLDGVPWPRLGVAPVGFLVLLAGFVVWCGASISWSIDPDRSWSYTNRGLVYFAFACLGVVGGALVPLAPRRLAAALAILLTLVVGWALLGKAIPALFPDGARIARLRNPVGYWNGLALLADTALPLGLWASVRREHPVAIRVGGVVLVYGAGVALVLTYSRAGVLIGIVGVLAWLWLERERFVEGLAALACSVPFAAAVAAWGTTLAGVADNGQRHRVRVHDGAYFGLAVVAGAVLAGGAAFWLVTREARRPLAPESRRLVAWAVSAAAAGAMLVVLVVLLVRAGGPRPWVNARWHDFTSVQVQPTQGPSRVSSFSSGNRWTWWKESWHAFRDEPLKGTGAGSFALVHRAQRSSSLDVTTEPHNLLLQFLAETGIVGFALLAGAGAAAGLGIRAARRRLAEPDRAAATALAVGVLAYGLHTLVDFDWDFVAVTGPALFVAGALLGAGVPVTRTSERQPLGALGAVAIAVAGIFSLLSPWLADRRVEAGLVALGRGDLPVAADAWNRAHSLNPFSVEPLLLWANAESAAGRIPKAKSLFRQAADVQPENPEVWYQFGRFELDVDKYYKLAYVYLNRSYSLDRFGPATDGSLDRARRLVNQAATARGRARGAPPASPSP
jgi:hypothetical protein